MKKFISVFTFIAAFTFLAATTTNAQGFVRNATNCTFQIKIAYGNLATCTTTGTTTVTVPPFTMFPVPAIPVGQDILASKGAYVGSSCVYYLSAPTCPYPYGQIDNVLCGTACGSYTAQWLNFPGFGSVIYLN